MLAKIPERDAISRVAREDAGRLRHDDLSSVGGRGDAGGAVDLEAEVVPANDLRLARVQPHPYPERLARPRLRCERALGRDGGADAGGCRREGGEVGIPLGAEGHAALGGDGAEHEP